MQSAVSRQLQAHHEKGSAPDACYCQLTESLDRATATLIQLSSIINNLYATDTKRVNQDEQLKFGQI
jgi:hypothetical protein